MNVKLVLASILGALFFYGFIFLVLSLGDYKLKSDYNVQRDFYGTPTLDEVYEQAVLSSKRGE